MLQNVITLINGGYAFCAPSVHAPVSAPVLPEPKGPTTGKGFVILDDYTINMSDNMSGVFLPVTPSVNMSAITQSADLSGCDDLVQVLYDGSNTSEDVVQSLYEYKASIAHLSDGI